MEYLTLIKGRGVDSRYSHRGVHVVKANKSNSLMVTSAHDCNEITVYSLPNFIPLLLAEVKLTKFTRPPIARVLLLTPFFIRNLIPVAYTISNGWMIKISLVVEKTTFFLCGVFPIIPSIRIRQPIISCDPT